MLQARIDNHNTYKNLKIWVFSDLLFLKNKLDQMQIIILPYQKILIIYKKTDYLRENYQK